MNSEIFENELIISTIAQGFNDLEKIADECCGKYPLELKNKINELVKLGIIIKEGKRYYHKSNQIIYKQTNANNLKLVEKNIDLPEPHPHDFDWRFDSETIDYITKLIIDKNQLNGRVLLLGTPTILVELVKFHKIPSTILIDWSKELLHFLSEYELPNEITLICNDLLSGKLWGSENTVDIVLCDPPWYLDHYIAFLLQAVHVTRIGGTILLSLLPMNTRPSAIRDRWQILKIAHKLGFHIQTINPKIITYETPYFELSSFYVNNLEINCNWRHGDLVILRKYKNPRKDMMNKLISSLEESSKKRDQWEEIILGRHKVKLRGPFSDYKAKPRLISIENEDVLPTVSRRYEGRQLVDLWLWDNRVFAAKGKAAFWGALNILAGRPIPDNVTSVNTETRLIALKLLQSVIENMN